MYKTGDIVWVNLGGSYCWWPAEFQEPNESKAEIKDLKVQTNDKGQKGHLAKTQPLGSVRFFDDDKFDVMKVLDKALIQPYSCKQKKDFILEGLEKFASKAKAKSGKNMFDYQARQAQFYKDVEMAEVMTDNDMEIAQILAQYEVVEDEDQEEAVKPPPKKKRRKRKY